MNNQPIGVIDSGVGGLNILTHLTKAFPHESFIYYGDTKNAPYGEKDIPTLKCLTENMIRFMEEKNVKILVIACNTITASGVLKKIITTIPQIIEIIEPTVRYAVTNSKSHHFSILATDVTIKSGVYQSLLKQSLPQSTLTTFSLPKLVVLAENGDFTSIFAEETIAKVARLIPAKSTVILGCTHYPFFTPLFKNHLDSTIQIIDSTIAVIEELPPHVTTSRSNQKQTVEYYVSGDRSVLQKLNQYLLDSSRETL